MHLRTALMIASFSACSVVPFGTAVRLPNAGPGIGFDDLQYSSALQRVLAPAGRAGQLALIDPESLAVSAVEGFSSKPTYSGGHDDGATSVSEGRGLLFVSDRTTRSVSVVDGSTRKIIASAKLSASPDYVRYVAATDELWVTEPSAARMEIFGLGSAAPYTPVSRASLPVRNGPESLVIDQDRGLAYTHRWQASTLVFDVRTRKQVAEWQNGCAASRGLALDAARRHVIVACSDGTISVLDAADGGKRLSSLNRGSGFDVIGYSPRLHHVYAAGGACACLVTFGVSAAGTLSYLGRSQADPSTHCAVADDSGHAWVCDPRHGKLWRVDDAYPASD